MKGVCAIIVSYCPGRDIIDNVAALSPQVTEIVIVDNGSGEKSLPFLEHLGLLPGCSVVYNGQNLGIAAALNIGVRHAVASGYSWIATFDQDSTVSEGFIDRLHAAWDACPFREEVALVAPRYRDRSTEVMSSYASGSGDSVYEEISHTITSGNLVRCGPILEVGLFEESFFMDCVDHEICLRLRRQGYRIIEAQGAILQHGLGNMTLHPMFGRSFKVYNHPPVRRYYNARNRVVIYRRYGIRFPVWVCRDFVNFCRELVGILLFEQDASTKAAAICKGIWHGLTGKMGRVAES